MSLTNEQKFELKCKFFDILYSKVLADDSMALSCMGFIIENMENCDKENLSFVLREYAYEDYLSPRAHSIRKRRILRFFDWLKKNYNI